MKNKGNIIIIILVIILGLLTLNVITKFKTNNQNQTHEEIIKTSVENTKDINIIKAEELETEIHKSNKLLVLKGSCTAKVTYSNKDINENTNDNFKWIKDKFSQWKSRELIVKAKYNFGFTYNMNNISVELKDNKYYIELSWNNLDLEYVEYIGEESYMTDKIGWISKGDFSPQEVNVLQERTTDMTTNTIRNNRAYRDKAIQSVIENIEGMCNKLGVEVIVEISQYDVVENTDAKIIK